MSYSPISRVADLHLRGVDRLISAKVYWPRQCGTAPALVVYLGPQEEAARICRDGHIVLAVEAPVEAAQRIIEWAAAHSVQLGASHRLIAAGPAAVDIVQRARQADWPPIEVLPQPAVQSKTRESRSQGDAMTHTTSHTLDVPGAVITYDVHEPQTPGPSAPLFVFGSPMGASGFTQLVPHFNDRIVITYDPRVTERSQIQAGTELTMETHGDDLHRVVEATGLGPVDAFGSSGGAIAALSWAVEHPEDVRTIVAHEPPLTALLEDHDTLHKVIADIVETYQRNGFGPGMAKFIQLAMQVGPLPADYLDRPAPDPGQLGLPTEDDGSRDDALLGWNLAMPPYIPDANALLSSGVRILPATGAEGAGTMAHRGGDALAELLGSEPVVFPGDHGGFLVSEWTPDNDPAAFAQRLRDVLDNTKE